MSTPPARIALKLIGEQHDLLLDVLAEIRQLVSNGALTDEEARLKLYTRLTLLADFIYEHVALERSLLVAPLKAVLQRLGNPDELATVERAAEATAELETLTKAFMARYSDPVRDNAKQPEAAEDIAMFIDAVSGVIEDEDGEILPIAERVTGRKSERIRLRTANDVRQASEETPPAPTSSSNRP